MSDPAHTSISDSDRQFLFELLNTPSPTGYETAGQRLWAARASEAAHEVESDAYGNVWASHFGSSGRSGAKTDSGKDEEGPRVLLEAHADEIGFAVKYIAEEGFLRIDRIGGSDPAIARGKRLVILGGEGPVPGVIGNTAIHIREKKDDQKKTKVEDLFVDVGADDREQVRELGIRVGHPAVFADRPEMLTENRLIARALDNRLGGFVLMQVLERVRSGERPVASTIALNAVQEEIGGNGARMAAFRLEPDVAVVLDVTHATDSPGIKKAKHGEVKLGKGPSITHGTVNHPRVVERLMEVAENLDIPLQHESSSRYSGTDTDVIFTTKQGIPSALVSIPLRYMHSTIEMVDLQDVAATVDLLEGFARSVREDDDFRTKVLG